MSTRSWPWLVRWIESRGLLPRISDTERAALEAGTVWMDGDIFSGHLSWDRLMAQAWPQLSAPEQAYLDGPVESLCRMISDWDVTRTHTIPPAVWAFLKKEGFFGLLIPPEHGGMGFSTLCASCVFGKLASRSVAVASVVLIPNSVGPAELLLHYGTEAQKTRYLRALAQGEEVPCFALTEPEAGSDAASIRSTGVVFRAADGSLCLRLNWRKRYITLAPVATLLGLACKVQDPDNLLGLGPAPGITCVMVPASTPGVRIGQRHDPMGLALPNGPTEGHDVVVSVEQIIGGPLYAGQGWRMLMECLSAGRAVSLPGQSAGGAKAMARMVGAYSVVRRQFGVSIGRFEGIEEPLARIGGFAYMMEAARIFTCGAIDRGEKPSVVAGLMKYIETELMRKIVQDGLDVMGGSAICRGPHNPVSNAPAGASIGITVEGANILTRTLIIFGQGAIRCHPFAQRELAALGAGDGAGFVHLLAGHAAFFGGNVLSSVRYYLTRPSGYFGRLAWASAQFAVLVDLALLTLGSRLKQKGRLSGRLADMLTWIFMGLATLRRFEGEGRPLEDRPLLAWSLEYCLWQIQLAVEALWQNFPLPVLAPLFGALARLNPLGAPPDDALGSQVADILRTPGLVRDRLTSGVHVPGPDDPLGQVEAAFTLSVAAQPIDARLRKMRLSLEEAVGKGAVTTAEADLYREAETARRQAIEVDSFESL